METIFTLEFSFTFNTITLENTFKIVAIFVYDFYWSTFHALFPLTNNLIATLVFVYTFPF